MFLRKKQTYIFQGLALSRFVWLLPYLALPTTCSTSGSCDLECALVSSFFRSRISRSWGFCVEAPLWSACSSLTPVRACCHAVSLVQQPFPGWWWGVSAAWWHFFDSQTVRCVYHLPSEKWGPVPLPILLCFLWFMYLSLGHTVMCLMCKCLLTFSGWPRGPFPVQILLVEFQSISFGFSFP